METENKDWKPEVGKTAWYFDPNEKNVIREGLVTDRSEVNSDHYWLLGSLVRHYTLLFQTPEAALASIKIYDLEGKEVLIPRADAFLAEKVLGLQMENGLLKKPVTTLAQAQMLLYEHGMILDLSGLSPILIERGRAAIGGKSDQREGGC